MLRKCIYLSIQFLLPLLLANLLALLIVKMDLTMPGPAFEAFQAYITKTAYEAMDHRDMDWEPAQPKWVACSQLDWVLCNDTDWVQIIDYYQGFGHKRFQPPQPPPQDFEDLSGPVDIPLEVPSESNWLGLVGQTNVQPDSGTLEATPVPALAAAQDEFGSNDDLPAPDDPDFDKDMEAAWAEFAADEEKMKKKKEKGKEIA